MLVDNQIKKNVTDSLYYTIILRIDFHIHIAYILYIISVNYFFFEMFYSLIRNINECIKIYIFSFPKIKFKRFKV